MLSKSPIPALTILFLPYSTFLSTLALYDIWECFRILCLSHKVLFLLCGTNLKHYLCIFLKFSLIVPITAVVLTLQPHFPFSFPLLAWTSNSGLPKALGPHTHVRDPEESPGSWLLATDKLSSGCCFQLGRESVDRRSSCFFLLFDYLTFQ